MRLNRITKSLASFRRDERGTYAIMMGLSSLMVLGGVGFAVETGRAFSAQSDMSNALDAAVTSVARDITTGLISVKDAPKAVQKFLDANAAGMAFGDGVTIDALNIDTTARTIEARAHTDVKQMFPFVYPKKWLKVRTTSAAGYSDKSIEVAMMLDVTGSMQGQKIKDLKKASANAVDAFLSKNGPNGQRVRVAIVPYAFSVNVGEDSRLARSIHVEEWFEGGNANPIDWNKSWGDPKLTVKLNTDKRMLPTGNLRPDFCATDRKGTHALTNADPYTALVARDFRLKKDQCVSAEIQPLTANKKKLQDTIASFEASGYTAGHIGIQWTWYMLTQGWKDFLPAESVPSAKGKANTLKYAVLMTDGEFNTAYAGNGEKVYNGGGQVTNSSDRAAALCKAMKAEGIQVFTVGFQLKEKNAKDTLQACATPDSGNRKYYYDVATGAELNAAFLEIARNVEVLALTK